MIIKRVCWNITSICNDTCKFCFRYKNIKSLSREDAFKVIDNLAINGVEHIALSGGEALLYDEIFPVMQYIKNKGIELTLISNGKIIDDALLHKVFRYVDWLTLPMDTLLEKNEVFYRKDSYTRVKHILEVVEKEQLGKIKINSVISKLNCEEIDEIYIRFISKYSSIKRWNLFEFLGRSDAAIVKNTYEMSSEQKEALALKIEGLPLCRNDLQIKLKGNDAILHSYVVILPNGDVIRESSIVDYETVGNLVLDNYSDVLSRLGVNEDLYIQRIDCEKIIVVK